MRLTKKICLVTGAGRGIGKAVCIALAREGATVIINDVDAESAEETVQEIRSMGKGSIFLEADVSKKKEVEKMFAELVKKFGRLDVLINNAGVFSSVLLKDMSEEEWDRVMNVNLKGSLFCSQQAMELMKKQKAGKIVNIASLAAEVGGIFAGANYSASKAGVICLTKSLAKQLAPYGITVNAVAPGIIKTEMLDNYPEKIRRSLLNQIPLHRFGLPEEVAETVLFLASDSSRYITGATIDVNGGIRMN